MTTNCVIAFDYNIFSAGMKFHTTLYFKSLKLATDHSCKSTVEFTNEISDATIFDNEKSAARQIGVAEGYLDNHAAKIFDGKNLDGYIHCCGIEYVN
jgi:predicted PP-loop superfamily ATPase